MEKIKKYKKIIIIVLVLIIAGGIYGGYKFKTENWKNSTEIDPDKLMDAIKYLESENPPRIGKNPTNEEIFNSPHIKKIRIALNGYLNGTNEGFEEEATYITSEQMKCGLDNFDKTYYQSKFVILNAMDNDWGGIIAHITFIDKPDRIFWVWVYGVVGEERLRMLCEKTPPEDNISGYQNYIEDGINNSSFSL